MTLRGARGAGGTRNRGSRADDPREARASRATLAHGAGPEFLEAVARGSRIVQVFNSDRCQLTPRILPGLSTAARLGAADLAYAGASRLCRNRWPAVPAHAADPGAGERLSRIEFHLRYSAAGGRTPRGRGRRSLLGRRARRRRCDHDRARRTEPRAQSRRADRLSVPAIASSLGRVLLAALDERQLEGASRRSHYKS